MPQTLPLLYAFYHITFQITCIPVAITSWFPYSDVPTWYLIWGLGSNPILGSQWAAHLAVYPPFELLINQYLRMAKCGNMDVTLDLWPSVIGPQPLQAQGSMRKNIIKSTCSYSVCPQLHILSFLSNISWNSNSKLLLFWHLPWLLNQIALMPLLY